MLKVSETSKKRTALGQGLDALLPIESSEVEKPPAGDVAHLPVDTLVPNPYQPRSLFSEDGLADLSNSIREMGVIQPLIVRAVQNGKYEIVAGERRYRAARMAGFSSVPVIVRDVSDSESLEIALIENLQRENLNPLDTAEAYDMLIRKFSYTHDNLAQRIGKDRSNITNHLRLLKLPDPIKQEVREDRLSMGHARTLLAVEHVPTQLTLSRRIVNRKLTVRELEKIVQNLKNKRIAQKKQREKDPDILDLEKNLARHLSTRVTVNRKNNNTGILELHFHSQEELDRLLAILGFPEENS